MCKSIRVGTQAYQILNHLQTVGTITGAEAYLMFKSRSTTKRISELRKAGYSITSEWRRDSTGQRYVRYWMDRKKPRRMAKIASIHHSDAFYGRRASLVGTEVEVLNVTPYDGTDYVSCEVNFPKGQKNVTFLCVRLEE